MRENVILKFNIFGEQIINDNHDIGDKVDELNIKVEALREVIFKIITRTEDSKFDSLAIKVENEYTI